MSVQESQEVKGMGRIMGGNRHEELGEDCERQDLVGDAMSENGADVEVMAEEVCGHSDQCENNGNSLGLSEQEELHAALSKLGYFTKGPKYPQLIKERSELSEQSKSSDENG